MGRSIIGVISLVAVLAAGGSTLQSQSAVPPATEAARVDINQATAAQLEALPGVGPATAARIVAYREEHGGFKKVEELMNVRGIGEKSFLRIKDLITVGAPGGRQAARSPEV